MSKLHFYPRVIAGVVFLVLFSSQVFAAPTLKTATLWGRTIRYEVVTISNARLSYDGSAFAFDSKDGTKVYRLVLNTAFFAMEAGQIWDGFANQKKLLQPNVSQWKDFVPSLVGLHQQFAKGEGLAGVQKKVVLQQLQHLDGQLEAAAWYPLYRQISLEYKNQAVAKEKFVRQFSAIRKSTIEFHELSHLLDEMVLQETKGKVSPAAQERFLADSEMRAFVTELAYGQNPRDSLWQAVSGVSDEIRRGKNVDSSLQKLAQVLTVIQKTSTLDQGRVVACLCSLSRDKFRGLAYQLYRGFRFAPS